MRQGPVLYSSEMQGFGTPNEAMKAISVGVTNGRYKLCTHLRYTLSGSAFEVIRFYYPVCAKDCSVSADQLHQEIGCPPDCRLYVNREAAIAVQMEIRRVEEGIERRKRFWRGVGKVVAAPFVYFRSLPPLVQSLIIILLIVWKLPKLRDTILEILKAIGGK